MNAQHRRTAPLRTLRGRTTSALLVTPLAVLIALTGCSAGTPDPGDPATPADPGPDTSTTDTGCLIDKTWQLDVDDMAAQLFDMMTSQGAPIVAVNGFGSHEMIFAEEGLATNAIDVTFEMIIAPEDAPTSTTQFRQFGSAYGDWAWNAGTDRLEFANWESDVELEMSIEIGGVVTTLPPSSDPVITDDTGANMSVTCSATQLETRPEASPFVQRWNATGG